MSFDYSSVKGLTLPEGEVERISIGGVTVWDKNILLPPTIELRGDVLILTATDNRTEVFAIYVANEEVATTTATEFNLLEVILPSGTYNVTAKARAQGLTDSAESNAVIYAREDYGDGTPGLAYELSYGYYTCTGRGTATGMDIVIAGSIDGIPVTRIANNAFYGDDLQSIVIPNSVTDIGYTAFEGCRYLSNVSLSASLTKISVSAFHECYALQSVNLPDRVNMIDRGAFAECLNLRTVTGSGVITVETSAFEECTSLENVTFSGNLGHIGTYAFYNCGNLTSFATPDTLTYVGEDAFYGCEGLIRIEDNYQFVGYILIGVVNKAEVGLHPPNTTKIIATKAFNGCNFATGIIIPTSVHTICAYAFNGCTNMTDIIYKGTMKDWGNLSKGDSWLGDAPVSAIRCTDGFVSIIDNFVSVSGKYKFKNSISIGFDLSLDIPFNIELPMSFKFQYNGIRLDSLNKKLIYIQGDTEAIVYENGSWQSIGFQTIVFGDDENSGVSVPHIFAGWLNTNAEKQ